MRVRPPAAHTDDSCPDDIRPTGLATDCARSRGGIGHAPTRPHPRRLARPGRRRPATSRCLRTCPGAALSCLPPGACRPRGWDSRGHPRAACRHDADPAAGGAGPPSRPPCVSSPSGQEPLMSAWLQRWRGSWASMGGRTQGHLVHPLGAGLDPASQWPDPASGAPPGRWRSWHGGVAGSRRPGPCLAPGSRPRSPWRLSQPAGEREPVVGGRDMALLLIVILLSLKTLELRAAGMPRWSSTWRSSCC